MMNDRSETDEQKRREKPRTKSGTFQAIVFVLMVSGALGILLGIFDLLSILTTGFTAEGLGDFLINTAVGALTLVCWRMLKAENTYVILVFFITILLSVGYSLAVGRGFNFFAAGFGAIILLQLIVFRRSGELP